MQSRIVVNSQEESLLSTHKVLRNTYFLLGLTMAFSAVVAYISMSLNLPYPNLIVLPANASIIKSSIPLATYMFKIGPMV